MENRNNGDKYIQSRNWQKGCKIKIQGFQGAWEEEDFSSESKR